MTRPLTLGALAAALAIALPLRAASAQCTVVGLTGATCVQSRTITATVLRTVRVTLTPTSTALPTPTATDFNNGFSVAAGPSVQVRANRTWQVTVRSTAATWTGTLGARTNKPRADLSWGTSIAGPWTAMTGTATVFATGGPTNLTTPPLFYRVLWSFTLDRPGLYTIALQYTISST
jgi:hypothetical protein